MFVNKGSTLIEALFALSISLIVLLPIITLLVQIDYYASLIDQYETLSRYDERMEDQFYPVTDLESSLLEVIDGHL